MLSKSSLSIRELMRLVVLAAFNLALFQGVWMIVVLPPITMIAAILNLTLYWTWVRRRPISRCLHGLDSHWTWHGSRYRDVHGSNPTESHVRHEIAAIGS